MIELDRDLAARLRRAGTRRRRGGRADRGLFCPLVAPGGASCASSATCPPQHIDADPVSTCSPTWGASSTSTSCCRRRSSTGWRRCREQGLRPPGVMLQWRYAIESVLDVPPEASTRRRACTRRRPYAAARAGTGGRRRAARRTRRRGVLAAAQAAAQHARALARRTRQRRRLPICSGVPGRCRSTSTSALAGRWRRGADAATRPPNEKRPGPLFSQCDAMRRLRPRSATSRCRTRCSSSACSCRSSRRSALGRRSRRPRRQHLGSFRSPAPMTLVPGSGLPE